MKQDRIQEILNKYNTLDGKQLRNLSFAMVLLGYKSFLKPFKLKCGSNFVERAVSNRAYHIRIRKVMAECMLKLQKNPSLMQVK